MEKLNINNIEITRDEANAIIGALKDRRDLGEEAGKALEHLEWAVKVPLFDEVEGIPNWSLYYLEYGEDDSLEEDERAMIDEFLEDNHYRFSSVKDGDEDGYAFDRYPQFGKACDTCTCYFEVLPKGGAE